MVCWIIDITGEILYITLDIVGNCVYWILDLI